jgi:Fur family peroxide stress response transcriptional regulator
MENDFLLTADFGPVPRTVPMKNSQERFNDIITRLRARNCRITPQRVAILKIFLDSREHPSVEQVYAQVRANFPTTSLATVYKTVNLLKEIGEILEISSTEGGSRFDGNKPYPHPHLICTQCKIIIDPAIRSLEELTSEVAAVSGYRIVSHQLDFFGICPACQKQS